MSRDTSRGGASSFAKLVARNIENSEAPTLLGERLEIGLDENLYRLFAGINLDTNRRIPKVNFVAASVYSSNDGVGHLPSRSKYKACSGAPEFCITSHHRDHLCLLS